MLVLVNHYTWFKHFERHQHRDLLAHSHLELHGPSFTEIASFFGICVWLVPFALFVSLSASDNVLPTMGSEEPSMSAGDSSKSRRGQSMVKAVVDSVLSALGKVGAMAGWRRYEDRL